MTDGSKQTHWREMDGIVERVKPIAKFNESFVYVLVNTAHEFTAFFSQVYVAKIGPVLSKKVMREICTILRPEENDQAKFG